MEHLRFIPAINAEMKNERLCFTDWHWWSWWRRKDYAGFVRIGGVGYVIGPEFVRCEHLRGFGGRAFDVLPDEPADKPESLRSITTHNLWSLGAIPERWRQRLPDNAKFVKGE